MVQCAESLGMPVRGDLDLAILETGTRRIWPVVSTGNAASGGSLDVGPGNIECGHLEGVAVLAARKVETNRYLEMKRRIG